MTLNDTNPIMLALFLGALSLLPFLLVVCTSFLKIASVLLITRNAIGVQQVPPNMALYGIALAATLFVMAPVFSEIATIAQDNPLQLPGPRRLQTGTKAQQE